MWDDSLDAKMDAARKSLADSLKKTLVVTKGDYKDVQGGPDGKKADSSSTEKGKATPGQAGKLEQKELVKTELKSEDKTGKDGSKAPSSSTDKGENTPGQAGQNEEKEVEKTELETTDGDGGNEGDKPEGPNTEKGQNTAGNRQNPTDQIKIWDIGFNFKVEIDGITVGSFQQFSGIKWETKVEEIREGGRNTHSVKLMGASSYSDVTLAKGYMSSNAELLEMRRVMLDESQKFDRISMSLIVCNDAGEEVGRYNFYDVWPTMWEGPTFDAKQSSLAIEKVKFAFSTFDYEPAS